MYEHEHSTAEKLPSPFLEFGHRLAIISWNAQLRGTYQDGALIIFPGSSIGCCRRCRPLPSHASDHSFPKACHHGDMFQFMVSPRQCSSPKRGRRLQKSSCAPRRSCGILPNTLRREGDRQQPESTSHSTLAQGQEKERHQRELHGRNLGWFSCPGSRIQNAESALCNTAFTGF